MLRSIALALGVLLMACSSPVIAADSLTIIYLDPQSPERSWFRIEEWPSYLFMPDAPLRVASSKPGVTLISAATGTVGQLSADLDCSDFDGEVFVGGFDPNRLDADGDGIGCE